MSRKCKCVSTCVATDPWASRNSSLYKKQPSTKRGLCVALSLSVVWKIHWSSPSRRDSCCLLTSRLCPPKRLWGSIWTLLCDQMQNVPVRHESVWTCVRTFLLPQWLTRIAIETSTKKIGSSNVYQAWALRRLVSYFAPTFLHSADEHALRLSVGLTLAILQARRCTFPRCKCTSQDLVCFITFGGTSRIARPGAFPGDTILRI